MSTKVKKYVAVVFSCLTLLAGWQWISVNIGNSSLFPGIYSLFSAVREIFAVSGFWQMVLSTVMRGLAGMFFSLVISLCLARIMSVSIFFKFYIRPFLTILRSVPVISFILLFLIWLSPGKIPFVMALITMIPILAENLETGFSTLSTGMVETGKVFGINGWRKFRYILYPALRPYLSSGLIAASGIGWKAIIIGEVLAQPEWGIGVAVKEAFGFVEIPVLIAWTVIAVMLSYGFEFLFRRLTEFNFPLTFSRRKFSGDNRERFAIIAEQVGKKYRVEAKEKTIHAVSDLSFRIEPGEMCCVCGPSGAGKSTLLRLLASLGEPDMGALALSGHTVSYLSQHTVLFPWFTVGENVMLPLTSFYSRDEAKKRTSDILREMGLQSLQNRMPDTLSGGEQRRVALARTFSYPSSLWLLDEPFNGIDEERKKTIMKYIHEMQDKRKLTVIFASHRTDEIAEADSRIAVCSVKQEEYYDIE